MKPVILLLIGFIGCNLAGYAQDNGSTNSAPTPAAEAAPVATNAPSESTTNASDQAAPAADTTNAEPMAEAPAPSAPAASTPTAPVQPGAIIPLIVMDEVPLNDAIRNLARQAGINYMLDPKLAAGEIGPNGKPAAQPMVSVRWENVTAAQALSALLDNYGLEMVPDPKTGIARITVFNAAAPPLFTKIIQLKYAAPTNVAPEISAALTDRRSKVIADVRTSQLVVIATEKELDAVEKLADELDTPTRQVLIETKLLETSVNPTSVKGIDWTGTFAAQNVTFGNGTVDPSKSSTATVFPGGSSATVLSSVPGTGGVSLNTLNGFSPAIGFLTADGVHAVLSLLNSSSDLKVLSEPRTVTLDNERAHIEVGQSYPIINVTAGTANTTGGSQITYSNLTVSLDVTPRISANDFINLKIKPHIMRLDHVGTFTVGATQNGSPNTFDVPIFDTRDIDTSVMIPSGDTLVMGGLMEDEIHDAATKVPLLGDIPLLGQMFHSDAKSRQKSNLLIFVTPTIVQNSDFQPTPTRFLQTQPVDQLEPDWTNALDSTKPYDWSKLQGSRYEDSGSGAQQGGSGPVFLPLAGETNTVSSAQ